MDLRVIPSQQVHYVRSKFSKRLVVLGSLWIRYLNLHVSLAGIDSIAEHLARKLLVKVSIHSLGVFCTSVIRNIACTE